MKLSALRYLVAFADERSFNRAAERCHVSQPALSVALQNLELHLGVTLIVRAKGHVALTDLGHRVAAQARRTLDEARRVELIAQTGRNPLVGEFRLGVIHSIAPYLLPELIASVHQTAPDMTLHIEENITDLLADYLKYGTVDAAIVALPFDIPGIETRPLYNEPFLVIVPPEHRWAGREMIAADEVRGDDVLVLKAGKCFKEQVSDACPDISQADGAALQGHSIETIRCMVASGHGISALPASALSGPYRSDRICAIPFEPVEPTRRVALAWRRGFTRLEAIEAISSAVIGINSPIYRPIEPQSR